MLWSGALKQELVMYSSVDMHEDASCEAEHKQSYIKTEVWLSCIKDSTTFNEHTWIRQRYSSLLNHGPLVLEVPGLKCCPQNGV